MTANPTTVIIGGVAGGMSTATRLRRNDEKRNIIVLEASGHVSFANCGLPYHIGGVIEERQDLLLQTPEALKERFNIDVRVNTRATHVDRAARTVTTESGETIPYDDLVLSPGATPFLPPITGIEKAYSLRTVEDVDRIAAALKGRTRAVIIGGGFIGLEMAENLRHRDLSVAVVEAAPQIMGPLDSEMAAIVTEHLRANGVEIRTNAQATEISDSGVALADGTELPADIVITAIGVRPASDLAREAGLEISERGGIVVDAQQRTSDPHIFALGDAATKKDLHTGEDTLVPLAQTANRHGRLVADIITGRETASLPVLGTAIVGLFGLAAASTGWNERRARAAGKKVRVIHLHPANHAGYYPGATQLHMKLVVDAETDTILGAQIVGKDGVDKRIDVIATAMRAGLKARDLADLELAYAPQFGSAKDPINFAGFIDDNIVQGERTVQWHELSKHLEAGTLLVDVRSASEFAAGAIPGAINIPLDELRARHAEIAGHKDVIVHCQVGLRGHNAARILTNLGYDVANLDGGYLTWQHGKAA
ncbi:FAD-dependent oxidoreductase [Corynebacterium striatum]|uniref:FAD-dependent oxidoreductase n=1 Tax=Corynebacterium striatum TaxID=43770 RepID=UPI001A3223C4|nr:FAD-dependent oxidoreductase [Corynebacterium striatum]MDC7105392.1 FAD-dependent oxidoreductase [Corynebacterium striatum]HAT1212157.1 FAD-dependent oxidoreductase [Corynebacterium striatum]HAT1475513.1 FAD-dependent oxidoreductase [Corynebacterium striatum]HAT6524391.1 CoA-disulfide reductase [Corynebacterium striatum]HAT6562523.1 CoA-disulfide reductase [Corynebacterium striatum]